MARCSQQDRLRTPSGWTLPVIVCLSGRWKLPLSRGGCAFWSGEDPSWPNDTSVEFDCRIGSWRWDGLGRVDLPEHTLGRTETGKERGS